MKLRLYAALLLFGLCIAAQAQRPAAHTFAVADGNDAFLTQTDVPQLTLYTCTGAFNPLERSYSERLVVVGELIEVLPRS